MPRSTKVKNGSARETLKALAVLMALICCAPSAQGFPNPIPSRSAYGVVDGHVLAIARQGGVTYIGGNFSELAAMTGAFARLDAATGRRSALLAEAENGEVRASVPDGQGGFYIGGTFTAIGGQPRAGLGHILADGSVDANFNPGVAGPANPAVDALAVSNDGRTLYVGGAFNQIGGQPRNNLAAINLTTRQVTGFDPAGLGTDGPVHALELAGTQVYVGGAFRLLGGRLRNGLAKVAASTGGDLGWVPNPTEGAVIRAIEASGDAVYVGGRFTGIGGQPQRNLARLSAASGLASWRLPPNPGGGEVHALLLSVGALYVGGSFDTIRRQVRPTLVRLDAETGFTYLAFGVNAEATDIVHSLAISSTGLYVGGKFYRLGREPHVSSSNLVQVDAGTGAGVPGFVAEVGHGPVKTIARQGTNLHVGGDFSFVNRITRHRVAALDVDGVPTAFDPDVRLGSVNAIAVRDNDVYLGGDFTSVGGQARNLIAKVSRAGALDPTFNPNATGGDIPAVHAIVVTSTDVYVGGDFSSIGGQPRLDLARLNPVTGLVDGGRQSFDPDPLNGVQRAFVRKLQVAGDDIWVCGEFTSIGGQPRSKIAKISGATGDADVQFDARVGGGSVLGPAIFDVVLARATLYVGGDFSSIGGTVRYNIATLNPRTGYEVTGFRPGATGDLAQVYAIAVTDDEVYLGGSFTYANGIEWGGLAAYRTYDSALQADFAPQVKGIVFAIAASTTSLYVGGAFDETLGRPRLRYAQFAPYPSQVSSNAIDTASPTSAVQPLDGVQDRASFAVEWGGEDDAAGVSDYSVFVAEDGGPFEPWLTNVPATRAMFEGADGATYEFYSIARDLAGNLEDKAPAAEATTIVLLRADDRDGDGVPDAEDRCPDAAATATVMVDGLDTGVANPPATPEGCTLTDQIVEAASGALNLRQFTRRVDRLTRTWLRDALIDEAQAELIRTAAARATLLRP
jgi:hypothetical protein